MYTHTCPLPFPVWDLYVIISIGVYFMFILRIIELDGTSRLWKIYVYLNWDFPKDDTSQ